MSLSKWLPCDFEQCHPLLWSGGILVDHWSTISSYFLLSRYPRFIRLSNSSDSCSSLPCQTSLNWRGLLWMLDAPWNYRYDDSSVELAGELAYRKNLWYKSHLSRQSNCWSLRCSWNIACRRCSNYIFILDLTPTFSGLGKDNGKTRRETFKFWDLVQLILEVLQYSALPLQASITFSQKCKVFSDLCHLLIEK